MVKLGFYPSKVPAQAGFATLGHVLKVRGCFVVLKVS